MPSKSDRRARSDALWDSFRKGKIPLSHLPIEAFEKSPWYRRIVRLVIGYIHFIAGIFWLGTIFSVPIIIKPHGLTHGLRRCGSLLVLSCSRRSPGGGQKGLPERSEKGSRKWMSLLGLYQALRGQGKTEQAEAVMSRLKKVWPRADVALSASRF
jgi:hypothetical protein